MKAFFQILAAVLFGGTIIGVIAANATSKPYVPIGQEEAAVAQRDKIQKALQQQRSDDSQLPQASCEAPVHHFGLMDPLTVGEHTFYIANVGKDLLTIRGGGSSCKCTLSDLENAVVAPGEKYPVKLTWNSGHSKREFKQLATVVTNDPLNEEIQLVVQGEVRAVVAALPTALNMDRLIPEAQSSGQFVLYSQVWDGMEVVDIESSDPHFSAELSQESFQRGIARDDEIFNASSKLVFNVHYDGNAPQGPVGGRIRVRVRPPAQWSEENQESLVRADQRASEQPEAEATDTPKVPRFTFPVQEDGTIVCEIPFTGRVVRRISLYGKQVSAEGIVDLGKLSPEDSAGASWNILGRIRGDRLPADVAVEVIGIPGLSASVDQFDSSKVRSSFRIRLDIAKALEPAIYNREQAGKLILKTPGMPEGDDILEMPVNLIILEYK